MVLTREAPITPLHCRQSTASGMAFQSWHAGFDLPKEQEDCQPPEKIAAIRTGKVPDELGYRYLRAINIDNGAIAWETKQSGPVLARPGPECLALQVMFSSTVIRMGVLSADVPEGRTLSHFDTSVLMKSSPMTYMAGGKQFVAITAGSDVLSFGLP